MRIYMYLHGCAQMTLAFVRCHSQHTDQPSRKLWQYVHAALFALQSSCGCRLSPVHSLAHYVCGCCQRCSHAWQLLLYCISALVPQVYTKLSTVTVIDTPVELPVVVAPAPAAVAPAFRTSDVVFTDYVRSPIPERDGLSPNPEWEDKPDEDWVNLLCSSCEAGKQEVSIVRSTSWNGHSVQ